MIIYFSPAQKSALADDIIKAHGGEIKAQTKVVEENPDKSGKGEGGEFIIQLSN